MDLSITKDGNSLVNLVIIQIACSDKKIRLFDLQTFAETGSILENESITSVFVARDGIHLLVNLSIQEIVSPYITQHLWNIVEMKMVKRFIGQKQGRFVIRSCFGGIDDNFVVSGSEGL